MGEIISLAAGSLIGGCARYFIGGAVGRLTASGMPYGTLAVNLLGCFLLGLLHSLAVSRLALGAHGRMLLMVGFCGAFTTFSTLIMETSLLMDKGRGGHALFNLTASVLIGFALFRLGAVLGASGNTAAAEIDNRPILIAENQPNA